MTWIILQDDGQHFSNVQRRRRIVLSCATESEAKTACFAWNAWKAALPWESGCACDTETQKPPFGDPIYRDTETVSYIRVPDWTEVKL